MTALSEHAPACKAEGVSLRITNFTIYAATPVEFRASSASLNANAGRRPGQEAEAALALDR